MAAKVLALEELADDKLTVTEEDFNFDEIDEDLANFEEDEMVQQALHRGVDLKKYARELEKDLRAAENESVTQYVENNQQVVDLHKQMQDCDAVLARMQDMLLGFQSDLGGISEEIKHLQDESMSMSVQLKNRKAAEDMLSDFIEKSTISVDLAEAIASPEVNEDFLKAVLTLTEKLKYLQNKSQPFSNNNNNNNNHHHYHDHSNNNNSNINDENTMYTSVIPSETHTGKSLLPDLEKLKMRALSKCRDYFTKQFQALRKPKTNIQVLQQSSLLKYSKLLHFIQMEAPFIGEELRGIYIESMNRTLYSLFKSYCFQLLKLDNILVTKYDLIAVEEATLKSIFTQKVNMTKRADSFALGERERILDQIESEPILLHVALAENQKYPFEAILRSTVKHLSDAATSEFLFILDFFSSNSRDTFNKVFGRTLSLILEYLENYLLNCHDAIGLLLMIKVTYLQRLVMQRRRIPVLDSFFDRISLLLWPRLKTVLESNLKSIKTINPTKLGMIELTPHFVCKRYAEFVASILILQSSNGNGNNNMSNKNIHSSSSSSLSSNNSGGMSIAGVGGGGFGGGGDSMLQHDLNQLRLEMIHLIERISLQLSSTKDRSVFLINNYDAILTILQQETSTTSNNNNNNNNNNNTQRLSSMRIVTGEESQKFEELLLRQREFFAEEEIRSTFPRLISFVLQTEQAMNEIQSVNTTNHNNNQINKLNGGGGNNNTIIANNNSNMSLSLDENLVESLVREFAGNWRIGIQQINDDVLAYFANFRNGMEILKQVLTQLLLYYTRFQDIIKKSFTKQPSFLRDIVSTATILMEIKRYSRSF